MTTCLLVRHGQSEANVEGILAGHLDSPLSEDGVGQIRRLAKGLFGVPLAQVVTSPLSRCRQTAAELCALQPDSCSVVAEDRFVEVRYGAWTGRALAELAAEPLWQEVQATPSTVSFPEHPDHAHESMRDLDERAWSAWQEWEERVSSAHGEQAVWVLVSHGDVIKTLLARALGLPLDAFQSIVVDPGSVSIVQRRAGRTAVSGLNLRDDVYARLARTDDDETGISAGVVGGGDA